MYRKTVVLRNDVYYSSPSSSQINQKKNKQTNKTNQEQKQNKNKTKQNKTKQKQKQTRKNRSPIQVLNRINCTIQ